jgi:hypothetical protein
MITILKKNVLEVDPIYIDHIIKFIKFTSKILKFDQDFKIYLLGKGQDQNATTGSYNIQTNTISVLYQDRALIDILRTIAHEIEHQRQNSLGLIGNNPQNIGGFLEGDSNILAGILLKLYVRFIKDHNIYWM